MTGFFLFIYNPVIIPSVGYLVMLSAGYQQIVPLDHLRRVQGQQKISKGVGSLKSP